MISLVSTTEYLNYSVVASLKSPFSTHNCVLLWSHHHRGENYSRDNNHHPYTGNLVGGVLTFNPRPCSAFYTNHHQLDDHYMSLPCSSYYDANLNITIHVLYTPPTRGHVSWFSCIHCWTMMNHTLSFNFWNWNVFHKNINVIITLSKLHMHFLKSNDQSLTFKFFLLKITQLPKSTI
jgi:hypothetical protein